MDQLRRELNFKQLTKLLTFYKIPGRSEMTTKEDKATALSIIPEVINNVQQILVNRREIFEAIDNMPRRRANQPQPPLPIPQIRQRNRPNLPLLNIPQPIQIPGTPPGSPDIFIPSTPPGTPPPNQPRININKNKPKRPSPPKPTRPTTPNSNKT